MFSLNCDREGSCASEQEEVLGGGHYHPHCSETWAFTCWMAQSAVISSLVGRCAHVHLCPGPRGMIGWIFVYSCIYRMQAGTLHKSPEMERHSSEFLWCHLNWQSLKNIWSILLPITLVFTSGVKWEAGVCWSPVPFSPCRIPQRFLSTGQMPGFTIQASSPESRICTPCRHLKGSILILFENFYLAIFMKVFIRCSSVPMEHLG